MRSRGFTLLEMLIVIVVVAILAAIALPSYLESVRKGRRADAVSRLAQVQQAQERFRANNPAYAADLTDLSIPATVDDGYYTLTIPETPASEAAGRYSATATALSGKPQESDAQCQTLIVEMRSGNILYQSKNSAGVLDDSANNRCWNR